MTREALTSVVCPRCGEAFAIGPRTFFAFPIVGPPGPERRATVTCPKCKNCFVSMELLHFAGGTIAHLSSWVWIGLGVVCAVFAVGIAYRIFFGAEWHAIPLGRVGLYSSEVATAYHGAINGKVESPITELDARDSLDVIWDTYGKDYWACYVRTSKATRAWVLCTSLRQGDG